MPPKTAKKTKAEEALAFLDDLDNHEGPPEDSGGAATPAETEAAANPRVSSSTDEPAEAGDAEADLAFLEAQINVKRAPLSVPSGTSSTPRTGSPAALSSKAPAAAAAAAAAPPASVSVPTIDTNVANTPSSGWGMGSFWNTASSALASARTAAEHARTAADEQYRKVRTEGVAGVSRQLEGLNVGGVDIGKLRKDAEERIGGIVQKAGTVDLHKLRELVDWNWSVDVCCVDVCCVQGFTSCSTPTRLFNQRNNPHVCPLLTRFFSFSSCRTGPP
jgi:hypothetical protein